MDRQQIAEAARDALLRDDRASRLLGIAITAVGPVSASAEMTVRDDMLNGHAICHGGFVTTLADTACAFACNAGNEAAVTSGFDVNLVAAARLGDVLTARAVERSRGARSGVYDVTVTNQHAQTVALFRGRSHTLQGRRVDPAVPIAGR